MVVLTGGADNAAGEAGYNDRYSNAGGDGGVSGGIKR